MTGDNYQIGDNARKEQFERGPMGGRSGGLHGGGNGGAADGGKAKKFGKTIGRLTRYCREHGVAIIAALLLAAAGNIFSIFAPNELRNMTDLITQGMKSGIDMDAVGKIGGILIVLYVLCALFGYLQAVIMATVSQKITKKLRTGISEKINRLPLSYFDGESFGNILSCVTNDVDMIGTTLQKTITVLVSAVTMLVGTLIIMLTISPLMTLTAVASVVIGFAVMMFVMTASQKYFVGQQNYLGQLNGHIEETYAGQSVVKLYNNVQNVKKTFSVVNTKLYESAWKAQFMTGIMMPFISFIQNLGYVAVCVMGAALVMSGHITFGVIIAFMLYTRQFMQPLGDLSQVGSSLQSAAAAGERIFGFMDLPEQEDESEKSVMPDSVEGNVFFDHVCFGYTPGKEVISDFSAEVKAGQKIAIVGPSGAGKTTLVNLLMRFYELNSGDIKVDGISTKTMKRESVRSLFSMVLQDTWLFEGTIRENVVYSKADVSDEQVKAACKAAGVHHFIKALPKGYDTVLSDAANLSVGQKQLLMIARAMIQNAPMLILDEATSSVDTRTEILIQKAMDRLMAGRTSFVIAHRLSTIRNADLILAMRDGDIIERGTHEELLAQDGFYSELYNSQFEQVMSEV